MDNTNGTYIAGDEVTQSFSSESPDINMDITTMAKKWFDGTNTNYGLLLIFYLVEKHQVVVLKTSSFSQDKPTLSTSKDRT